MEMYEEMVNQGMMAVGIRAIKAYDDTAKLHQTDIQRKIFK